MKKLLLPFRNLPFMLLVLISCYLFFKEGMSIEVKSFFYSLSLSIKSILVFLMPLIIIMSIFSMLIELGKSSFSFVCKFVLAVCCSNTLCTFIAYCIGSLFSTGQKSLNIILNVHDAVLYPLWNLTLPSLMPNDYALMLGITLGLILSYRPIPRAEYIAKMSRDLVSLFLKKVFIPIVPIFILGFIIKLDYDGILQGILKTQGATLLAIFFTQYLYILLLYSIAAEFSFKRLLQFLKNVFPPFLTGFCTMSSAATIPLTIQAAEKNTNNNPLTKSIVIGTANIHLIGDSIGVPLMAIAILVSFNLGMPDLPTFMAFALHFVIAKFCIAAVPGGGIIAMIPVLEQQLGFTPEMSAIISAFYVLFDPVNTAANVTGNGAFAILFTKIFGKSRDTEQVEDRKEASLTC